MGWRKDARLISLIFLILIAAGILAFPYLSPSNGVKVISVSKDSPCKDIITQGSIITEVAGVPIKNSQDFVKATRNLRGSTTFIINYNPRSCMIPENSSLGVKVKDVKKEGIKLGVEVGGGVYYYFKPKNQSSQTLKQTLSKLESRIKEYDLMDTKVKLINGSFRILTTSSEEDKIWLLTEKGDLEGDLLIPIEFTKNEASFNFNGKVHKISLQDDSVSIEGSSYKEGESFELDGVKIRVQNISKNMTYLYAKVFDENDLTTLKTNRRIIKQTNGYVFVVYVTLSEKASENFQKATRGQEATISPSGESFLKTPLVLLIDDKTFLSLPVSESSAGKNVTQLALWGFRRKNEDATQDMIRLSSIIELKGLPTELILERSEEYIPTSSYFLTLPFYAILISSSGAIVFFFLRYKKRGVLVLHLILLTLAELLLILASISLHYFVILLFIVGVALSALKGEIIDWKGWIGISFLFLTFMGIAISNWSLDVSSLIGLTCFIFFSMIEFSVIGDRLLSKKEVHVESERKRSLRILWFSTTITAIIILPVFLFGFVGFTSTFAVGILVSSTLTKPVYWNAITKIK